MSEQRADYLTQLITTGSAAPFATTDGQRWRMRQPTPEQSADGSSAYRLMHGRVMNDLRLQELADDGPALKREANIRASAAEAAYMLPLLLEVPDGPDDWRLAFDVFDLESLAEFEALEPGLVAEMTAVYWGTIQAAIVEAKKKPQRPASSTSSPSVAA